MLQMEWKPLNELIMTKIIWIHWVSTGHYNFCATSSFCKIYKTNLFQKTVTPKCRLFCNKAWCSLQKTIDFSILKIRQHITTVSLQHLVTSNMTNGLKIEIWPIRCNFENKKPVFSTCNHSRVNANG